MTEVRATPEGIAGSTLPGPFPVGAYAHKLQVELRKRARVQLVGEVYGLKPGRGARVYFELRDAGGALPCAMWRDAWDALGLPPGAITEGTQVVIAGGPDYYRGSRTASPAFSFDVLALRVAGAGDLLAQVERLRRGLDAEGLLDRQARLPRPLLPRTIGVVTGEGGKARDDVLAGLHRRGWGGRLVWAFAPVQDRHAAPAITRAVQDLAAAGVEVIIVARGGGSWADLLCFCDETLCRTVALLPVPVIASVGHHTDRTLLDDVAAVACSTPTHAAEAAVRLDVVQARAQLHGTAERLAGHGRRAVLLRARHLAALSRAPAAVLSRQRARLHQLLREIRASATRRGLEARRRELLATAQGLDRRAAAGAGAQAAARRAKLEALGLALAAHDPARVLERGYAVVRGPAGELLVSAAEARAAGSVELAWADGSVRARIEADG